MMKDVDLSPSFTDLETFQDDVLLELSVLVLEEKAETIDINESRILDINGVPVLPGSSLKGLFRSIAARFEHQEKKAEITKQATKVVQRKNIKHYICPALESVSDDAFEICKIITPILVSLTLSGTINIPLEPTLYATISLVIARMSISSLCVETEKKGKSQQPKKSTSKSIKAGGNKKDK